MIELTFLKILVLIRQAHQKSLLFVIIIFLDKRLKFQLDLGAQFFFIVYKRWIKEIVTFDNIEIEKGIFHHLQNIIFLEDEDIENI